MIPKEERTEHGMGESRLLAACLNLSVPTEAMWEISPADTVYSELYAGWDPRVTALVVALNRHLFLLSRGDVLLAVTGSLIEAQAALDVRVDAGREVE